MALRRPPRPAAGAVTDRVRRAIILAAERNGITATTLMALHGEAEHLGSPVDLMDDVEERYELPRGSLSERVNAYLRDAAEGAGGRRGSGLPQWIYEEHAPRCILMALPDTEFLTVLEHAAGRYDVVSAGMANQLFEAADAALRTHGAPYRRATDRWGFDWVGDEQHYELTTRPALLALADPRLAGAHAEFHEALRKRRHGAAKDLEDAIDEAAKAVESLLQVLHRECNVKPPRSEQLTPLFNSLVAAGILPGYVDKLVAATAGPRNNMASHGQGASVREMPEELADASIAAAATAITFLVHYLP